MPLSDDALRLDRLLRGDDLAADNRAASAWRGLLSTGVVYLGQGDGCDAAGIVRHGRRIARPHGWREAVRSPKPLGSADAAWAAAYAALTGPARAQRRGLTRAVALAPGRPAFLILRGLCHLVVRNGLDVTQDPAARADLEAAAEAETRSPWAPLALGLSEYLAKHMRRARELFEEASRLDPRDPWPVVLAADALYYNSSFPEASARFEEAVRLDPDCAWSWALLGRARYLQGDPKMVDALDRAAELAPRSGWILCWRGAAWALLKDHSRARRDFKRAALLEPRYDRTQAWYGAWLCGRGELAEGLRRLRLGTELNPWYEVTWYARATAELKRGRFAAAKSAMRRAIKINLETTWARGWTDVQDADPACARVLENLRVLLARWPKWGEGQAWFGQTALLLRRHAEARPALAAARLAGALAPWPSIWQGLLERRLGRAVAAEALFFEAAAAAPDNAWAWAGRGASRLDQGRTDKALADLDRALALDPRAGRGLALLWRALARKAAGLEEGATADARAALAWYPHWAHWLIPHLRGAKRPFAAVAGANEDDGEPSTYDSPSWVRRGRRRLSEGDATGALEDLSRVLEECLDPTCVEALLLRSRVHVALGDAAAAASDLGRARAAGVRA
jgi:tetratricopeptide (TPR) repeat protein